MNSAGSTIIGGQSLPGGVNEREEGQEEEVVRAAYFRANVAPILSN